MKVFRTAVCLVLAAASAVVAAEKPASETGDLARFQGTWKATFGPDKNVVITLVLKGNDATLVMTPEQGDEFETKGTFQINEKAQPHKTADWIGFTHPDGQKSADNLSIYEFEGNDTLKICAGGPGKARPADFTAGDDGEPLLLVLKRSKPETVPDVIQGDLAKFQGKWGALFGPNRDIPLTILIEAEAVTISGTRPNGDPIELKGRIKLDEGAKPHKTIDWTGFMRADGEPSPDNLAIYAIENEDTIKVCSGGPGNPRPTEFKAGDNGPPNLVVLNRKKD